jgi:ABC-type dipeptide/oligopeptide/nickel transport system permease component
MSRWNYLLRRIALAIPVLIFATSMTFLIIRAGPQDPVLAILGTGDTGAYHEVAVKLGIERRVNGEFVPVPLWEQYIDFVGSLFTGDFGQSWVIQRGTPVTDIIVARAPATIWLGFWSVLVALFTGPVVPGLLKVGGVFAVQQVVEAVVGPYIVGESVGLHPVWVLLALALFSFFLGFVGLLLAVPLAVLIKLGVREALGRTESGAE